MNKNVTPKGDNIKENELYEKINEYEEYYLIKENNAFKFIVGKTDKYIIIRCKNYEIKLNNNDLTILTKSLLNTINDAYEYIINIFDDKKVVIKDIINNKTISILLRIYILNKEKDIEFILTYNKSNKDLIINELNNNYNNLKNNINNLKEEINKLKN